MTTETVRMIEVWKIEPTHQPFDICYYENLEHALDDADLTFDSYLSAWDPDKGPFEFKMNIAREFISGEEFTRLFQKPAPTESSSG